MNLPLKSTIEHRDQPLQSPRKMNFDLPRDLRTPKKYDSPELRNYIRAFRKEIELPINYQTSIFISKTPQRCLNHNNVITLFCIQDKKPLCVHCMYQIFSHKKHQVVPISRATVPLRQVLSNTLQNISNSIIPKIAQLITKNQVNLAKVEREMGEHIMAVTKFYNQLTSFVNNKKNEHLKYCQQLWNKFRYQYSSFASELVKTNLYMRDKMRQISERSVEQHLLFNHNIAIYLEKVDSILPPLIGQYHALEHKEVQQQMEVGSKNIREFLNFDYKIDSTEERRNSLQKVYSLGKIDKNAFWKGKKPDFILKIGGENYSPPKETSPRFFYRQSSKIPFTPRQYVKNLNSPRHQRQKPKFIGKNSKKNSQQPSPKQQSSKKQSIKQQSPKQQTSITPKSMRSKAQKGIFSQKSA